MNEPLHISGDCRIADLSESDRMRLASACGEIYARGTKNLALRHLKRVGGIVFAERSVGLDMSALAECYMIFAADSTDLDLGALVFCHYFYISSGTTGLVISDDLARLHNIHDSVRAKK